MEHKTLQRHGKLEVICGGMFSGKTEELIRRLKRAEIAKQSVLTIKHEFDKRRRQFIKLGWYPSVIISHSGSERQAIPIDHGKGAVAKILGLVDDSVDVLGIDEIQFFPETIVSIICQLVDKGKRIIVSGLDTDFRGLPFGIMPSLLAIADDVTKLKAICSKCSKNARHSQRIVNGKPAKFHDELIVVGAEECYEARCRGCFNIDISVSKSILNEQESATKKSESSKEKVDPQPQN